MYLRTLNFIEWHKYLDYNINNFIFLLDFQIDAGFSFSQAIICRDFDKNKSKIADISDIKRKILFHLRLNYQLDDIKIREIKIRDVSGNSSEITDRYLISITFSLINLKNQTLNEIFTELGYSKEYEDIEISLKHSFNKFWKDRDQKLMNEIISFIEYSGFYANQVLASLNFYLINDDQTDDYDKKFLRIFQRGGGIETSAHNPIHPLLIKRKFLISEYKKYLSTPKYIKQHYAKGVHYHFLGFYDESFLCFYKIIEFIFKEKTFLENLSQTIFKIKSKDISNIIKSSNQKIMMLYIYQYLIETEKDFVEDDKRTIIIDNLILASELRNNIAHGSNQQEKSKKILPFLINFVKIMIEVKKNISSS